MANPVLHCKAKIQTKYIRAFQFKASLPLQSHSESMLELISILKRKGLRKTTLFVSGGKFGYKTNKQGWAPPIRPQHWVRGNWWADVKCRIAPTGALCKRRLAIRGNESFICGWRRTHRCTYGVIIIHHKYAVQAPESIPSPSMMRTGGFLGSFDIWD